MTNKSMLSCAKPLGAAAALAFMLRSGAAHAAWTLNLTRGVTGQSHAIYGLHMLVLWICVGIAVVVFGVMIFSLFRYRRSKGAVPATHLTHSTRVEVVWTLIPVLILVGMAIPAARVLVMTANATGSQITIRVTGYQWKWEYHYVGYGVRFFSTLAASSNAAAQLDSGINPYSVPHYLRAVDHPMVVPAGVKVRLLITSGDVIHGWWVPALGIQKDAIPGFINQAWFRVAPNRLGTYRGACAQLCGRGHAFMPIVVKVVSPAAFASWLKTHGATHAFPAPPSATAHVAALQGAAGHRPAAGT